MCYNNHFHIFYLVSNIMGFQTAFVWLTLPHSLITLFPNPTPSVFPIFHLIYFFLSIIPKTSPLQLFFFIYSKLNTQNRRFEGTIHTWEKTCEICCSGPMWLVYENTSVVRYKILGMYAQSFYNSVTWWLHFWFLKNIWTSFQITSLYSQNQCIRVLFSPPLAFVVCVCDDGHSDVALMEC